jgi:uncharacterized protein (DUF488 family)
MNTLEADHPPMIFTIGHSTRSIEDFLAILRAHGVTRLVDVRTVPRSRHNPQFNRETLPHSLRQTGIAYILLSELGGLRRARRDSPNTGWRNASFRGFADYMQTSAFGAALEKLIKAATNERTAIMCAEAVPWRCHRSLIADALMVRGIPVDHILDAKNARPHALTPFAKVEGTRLAYPSETLPMEFAKAQSSDC